MRKFTASQVIKDISLPTALEERFKPLLTRLVSKQSGSLIDHASVEQACTFSQVIHASHLCIGPVQEGHEWSCAHSLYKCLGPSFRDHSDAGSLIHLKKMLRCYIYLM